MSLSGRQFESHTQKTWKKQGGNAQQCIQGYIVQPKEKKAYRGNSTGTDNQRASESLIVPLPVLVVLVMVP